MKVWILGVWMWQTCIAIFDVGVQKSLHYIWRQHTTGSFGRLSSIRVENQLEFAHETLNR